MKKRLTVIPEAQNPSLWRPCGSGKHPSAAAVGRMIKVWLLPVPRVPGLCCLVPFVQRTPEGRPWSCSTLSMAGSWCCTSGIVAGASLPRITGCASEWPRAGILGSSRLVPLLHMLWGACFGIPYWHSACGTEVGTAACVCS